MGQNVNGEFRKRVCKMSLYCFVMFHSQSISRKIFGFTEPRTHGTPKGRTRADDPIKEREWRCRKGLIRKKGWKEREENGRGLNRCHGE